MVDLVKQNGLDGIQVYPGDQSNHWCKRKLHRRELLWREGPFKHFKRPAVGRANQRPRSDALCD